MDNLTRVRDLRHDGPSDLGPARAALDAAISAPHRSRSRARGVALGATALAVAGVITASSIGLLNPESVAPASAAQTILVKAADMQVGNYDFPVADGQFLRTSVQYADLVYVGKDWQAQPEPFRTVATDAAAAVATGSTTTVYKPAGADPEYTIESVDFHGVEAYGDTAAAQAAWAKYYEAAGTPQIGTAGAPSAYRTTSSLWKTGGTASATAVLPGDFPSDPQKFLDAWTARAGSGEVQRPVVEQLWFSLTDPAVIHASGKYRAALLGALALTDGATVERSANNSAELVYKGNWGTYRVAIDTEKGLIQKVQVTNSKIQDWSDGSGKPVDTQRPAFVPATTADLTVTIDQSVVDSAPKTDIVDN